MIRHLAILLLCGLCSLNAATVDYVVGKASAPAHAKLDEGQHFRFEPPYFQNLDDLQSLMYPVIKGNAATGGVITSDLNRHFYEYSC